MGASRAQAAARRGTAGGGGGGEGKGEVGGQMRGQPCDIGDGGGGGSRGAFDGRAFCCSFVVTWLESSSSQAGGHVTASMASMALRLPACPPARIHHSHVLLRPSHATHAFRIKERSKPAHATGPAPAVFLPWRARGGPWALCRDAPRPWPRPAASATPSARCMRLGSATS